MKQGNSIFLCRVHSPYRLYRMWMSNKRPYYCKSSLGKGNRITWGTSLQQIETKFQKWDCRCLIPHK